VESTSAAVAPTSDQNAAAFVLSSLVTLALRFPFSSAAAAFVLASVVALFFGFWAASVLATEVPLASRFPSLVSAATTIENHHHHHQQQQQQAVESTSAAVSPTSDQNAATRPHSGGLCISKTSTIVSYRGVLSWLLTFLLVGCCYNSDYISDGPNVMKWRSGSGALGLALTDMEELKADGVIAKQVTTGCFFLSLL